MKVSVLIPYYNDREFLPRAIESVLNQTYKDFELILVNHVTTDDCREIAHSYKDSRIKHVDMDRNYSAGTGLIMKKFLEYAQGEFVKPFCADDVMYPNCLEDLVKYAQSHPEIDMVFGDVEYIDEKEESLNNSWFQSRYGFSLKNNEIDFLRNYFNGYSTLPYIGSFVKTEKLKQIEIDVSSIMNFDMQLWSSLLILGCKLGYLNKYISGYRVHENQMCSNKHRKLVAVRGTYEVIALTKKFLKIKDFEMIKKIFNKNPFIKQADANDIEFIVAYEMYTSNVPPISYQGYSIIYSMLQDEKTRNYLEQKFNFGIIEFRKIYSSVLYPTESCRKDLYFFFKKTLKKITFYKYWQKSSKKIM